MSETQLDGEIGSLPQSAEKVHNDFLSLVFQLVDGRLDSSSYEDLCRSLLGMFLDISEMKSAAPLVKGFEVLSCPKYSLYLSLSLHRQEDLFLSFSTLADLLECLLC